MESLLQCYFKGFKLVYVVGRKEREKCRKVFGCLMEES